MRQRSGEGAEGIVARAQELRHVNDIAHLRVADTARPPFLSARAVSLRSRRLAARRFGVCLREAMRKKGLLLSPVLTDAGLHFYRHDVTEDLAKCFFHHLRGLACNNF